MRASSATLRSRDTAYRSIARSMACSARRSARRILGSAYERRSATYQGEEAKGRMALLLQRTGAEQRARAIFVEIRKSVERDPAFYRRAQRDWYEIARRHA